MPYSSGLLTPRLYMAGRIGCPLYSRTHSPGAPFGYSDFPGAYNRQGLPLRSCSRDCCVHCMECSHVRPFLLGRCRFVLLTQPQAASGMACPWFPPPVGGFRWVLVLLVSFSRLLSVHRVRRGAGALPILLRCGVVRPATCPRLTCLSILMLVAILLWSLWVGVLRTESERCRPYPSVGVSLR